MKLIKVESSHVIAVGYENCGRKGKMIYVVYPNGLYSYALAGKTDAEARKIFNDLLNAKSKGRFLNTVIKPYSPYKHIIDETEYYRY